MAKKMTREAYEKALFDLHEYLKSDSTVSNFRRSWEANSDYGQWTMSEPRWAVVMELPPLVAAAIEHGKPKGDGKWAWYTVSPETMEKIFGEVHDRFAEQLKEMLNNELGHGFTDPDRQYREIENRSLAYRRFREFEAALKKAGVTQYRTDLTEHGFSEREVKALEKYIADKATEIDAVRNPQPKDALFEAPKKGKYPVFDDTEYEQFVNELRDKYRDALDKLISYGLPLADNHFGTLAEALETFDYTEICATFGAQKRWPPEDDYGSNAKLYEIYANLPQSIARRFVETTVSDVDNMLTQNLGWLNDPIMKAMHAQAFNAIREIRRELAWLAARFPTMDCPELAETRNKVARAYDPRWALMAGGPLHEKRMKQIVFTTSPFMPASEDDIPDAINPAKEPVYAHVFLEQALGNLGTMYFVAMKDQWLQASKQVLSNPESAWQVLQLFPEPNVGRDPDLVKAFGKALEAAADDGELLVEFKPDATLHAAGTLKLKMSAADIKKIGARTEELASAADANRTAEAVLPDIFTEPQKWPYKDKVLTQDKVKAAIETAWEHGWKQTIQVKAMRVRYYRAGHEWNQEIDLHRKPIARLAFSYIAIVFERDGKTYCVDDGIQLRQFYMLGEGYGEDLNVLFWGAKPFELPATQIKRMAK